MKKVIFGLIATVLFSFNTKAQDRLEKDDLSVLFSKGKFGYFDKDKFISKDINQTHVMISNYFEIDIKLLDKPKIIKAKTKDSESYYLYSNTLDGRISIAIPLDFNSKTETVSISKSTKPSIKCETQACNSSWGCTAESQGTSVYCSHCSGDCKKTTEIKAVVESFED